MRAERTRDDLAEHFGIEVADEESAAMGRKLREAFAALRTREAPERPW
jgi:hypothetical protein